MFYNALKSEISLRTSLVTEDASAITLAVFKEHIKWDSADTSEDVTMQIYLTAAIQACSNYTRRALNGSSWVSTMRYFSHVEFDVSPIDLSSVVVKYFDLDNVEQTLPTSNYTVIDNGDDAYPEICFKGSLPSLFDRYDAVKLEFDAGYDAEIPEALKVGILERAATYFENRQDEVVGTTPNVIGFHSHPIWFPYKMLG